MLLGASSDCYCHGTSAGNAVLKAWELKVSGGKKKKNGDQLPVLKLRNEYASQLLAISYRGSHALFSENTHVGSWDGLRQLTD